MTKERVLVAMSGGVDSSVAAALLVEQGYDVVGATMKLFCHGEDVPDRPCCSLDSVNDARRVCEQLGIPHYVLNLESRFGHDVVDNFVDEYSRGRTPIPCVRCNTFTKFRDFLKKADAIDAQWIATGHYARVVTGELRRGADENKDQTYFLWGIDRAVLSRMILPVGGLDKAQTRARAHAMGLEVIAEKPESQEICFVPDGDYARILEQRLPHDAPALAHGPIITSSGAIVGNHTRPVRCILRPGSSAGRSIHRSSKTAADATSSSGGVESADLRRANPFEKEEPARCTEKILNSSACALLR